MLHISLVSDGSFDHHVGLAELRVIIVEEDRAGGRCWGCRSTDSAPAGPSRPWATLCDKSTTLSRSGKLKTKIGYSVNQAGFRQIYSQKNWSRSKKITYLRPIMMAFL